MRSVSSYLLLFLMVIFWVFRIVVAFTTSMGIEIGFEPLDMNTEIILLFVTLLCIGLVGKRKLIGAIIYVIAYGMYFGVDLYNNIINIVDGATLTLTQGTNFLISFIGVIIPVAVLFTLLVDKNRTNHPVDNKTDWFYKNEEFDRKVDERADQNQYRNY